ncbi:hypothetical protein K469DRAFT_678351 [Zopfia rhizophila CBS 207.26]|uniref:Coenzyme Q-binding protein COQ10 START domain-containing protein n=1 Tax=Zopfia rhizophila CBS 207.26 TaxID=1314779 RepID=A0A6A6DE78_9PEZI|nr:hypothetical protein K469DRAFT_678351 [Zopfia rhizophila CBS 207.26]
MATKSLRPLLYPPRLRAGLNPSQLKPLQSQHRTFLPNPFPSQFNPLFSQPQKLTASRTLPYPPTPIYNIISDVSSYSSFLPYCQFSTVTKWSQPDRTHNLIWPSEAKLVVGWGSITESFTSRIFCIPGKVVESVGGSTQSTLDRADIQHHLGDEVSASTTLGDGNKHTQNQLLTHLSSRWTINPVPAASSSEPERTEVSLSLEFAFVNPLYTTLSAGAAPKVADIMIKAFEERVKFLLRGSSDFAKASLGNIQGGRSNR